MPLSLSALNAAVDAMKVEASSVQSGVDALSQKCTSGCNILGTAGSTFGDSIRETASAVEKSIGDGLKGLGGLSSSISGSIDQVTDIIKKLAPKLPSLTAGSISVITDSMTKITSSITDVKDSLSSGPLDSLFTDITSGIDAVSDNNKSAISGVLKGSCPVTLDALKGLGSGASAEVDKIQSAVSSAAGSVTGSVTSALGSLPSIPGKEVQNIATSLVGDNMKSSLAGLSSTAENLNDTIGELTKTSGGAIQSALAQLRKFAQ